MDTVLLLDALIDEFVTMNEHFSDIALGDGFAPILVAAGTLIIVAALAVFGGLTLGALASLVTAD